MASTKSEIEKLEAQILQLKQINAEKENTLQQMAEKVAALNQEIITYQEATYKELNKKDDYKKKIEKKSRLVKQEVSDINLLNNQYQQIIKQNSELHLDLERLKQYPNYKKKLSQQIIKNQKQDKTAEEKKLEVGDKPDSQEKANESTSEAQQGASQENSEPQNQEDINQYKLLNSIRQNLNIPCEEILKDDNVLD